MFAVEQAAIQLMERSAGGARGRFHFALAVVLVALCAVISPAYATAGFTEDYLAAAGDVDGDGLSDIYVKPKPDIVMIELDDIPIPIARPAPVTPFVLRRRTDQTFELLSALTTAQRAVASQLPVSPSIRVDAVDANIDAVRDLLLTGVSGANPVVVYSSTTERTSPQATKTGDALFTTFLTDMFNWILDPAIPGIVTEFNYYALADLILNQIPINGLPITDDPYDPEFPPDVCWVTDCYFDFYYGWVVFLQLQYEVTIYQHPITSQDAWDLIQIFGPIMDDVTVVAQTNRARAIADILERIFGTEILGGTLRDGGRQDPESDLPNEEVPETRGIGILTMLTELAAPATNVGDWRLLTTGEKLDLAAGNGMRIKNVDKVRVYRKGFLGLNSQIITPGGNIFVGRSQTVMPWSQDYSVEVGLTPRSTFVHELLHVYQSRNRGCGYVCKGFRKLFSDYCYNIVPGKDYWSYNMEEQAELMSDRYRLRQPFGVVYQSCNNAATSALLEQAVTLR